MDSNRRTALTVGILFIAATAASLLGTAVEGPVLRGTDYLTRISENMTRVSAGGLMELIAAGTSAGIAISLYPVLKRWSGTLALGARRFQGHGVRHVHVGRCEHAFPAQGGSAVHASSRH